MDQTNSFDEALIGGGSENGAYNGVYKKFGANHKIILPIAADKIEASINKIIQHKQHLHSDDKEIRVLDYGCGPGRYLQVYEMLAERCGKAGFHLRYICYDPYEGQPQELEMRLEEEQYKRIKGTPLSSLNVPEEGCAGPIYRKGNLTVEFIIGDKRNDISRIKELLPEKTDLTVCLFSVYSHISGKETRPKILALLNDITDYAIQLSVPTKIGKQTELAFFDSLRQRQAQGEDVGKLLMNAVEEGDIRYVPAVVEKERHKKNMPTEAPVTIFMHPFKAEELIADFDKCGFEHFYVGAANLISEHTLVNRKLAPAPKSHWRNTLRLPENQPFSQGASAHLARLDDAENTRAITSYSSADKNPQTQILQDLNDKAWYLWATALTSKGIGRGLNLDDFCGKASKQSTRPSR